MADDTGCGDSVASPSARLSHPYSFAFPTALLTTVVLLVAPLAVSARDSKPMLVGVVTYVSGSGVKVSGRIVGADGNAGKWKSNVRKLYAGDVLKATEHGYVEFTIRVGAKVANCRTVPDDGVVVVRPSAAVFMDFRSGASFCGTPASPGEKFMNVGPKAKLETSDPVFEVTVTPKTSVIKVRRGSAVVTKKGKREKAVVAGRNQQVVVAAGGDPLQPKPITLTRPEQRALSSLEGLLPAIRDTTPPKVSVKGPPGTTVSKTALFTFRASETTATLSCALDNSEFHVCMSPQRYAGLKLGRHTFFVRATDEAGNTSRAASYSWTIVARTLAAPVFGVAEDATKYAEDGGAALFARMRSLGMVEDRIAVRWNHLNPTEIFEQGFLDRALPVAARAGVRVVFQVFPLDPGAFSVDTETRAVLFAAYLQALARRYPQVTDFIVANEPNETYFWRPQFGPSHEQVSAAAFLQVLTRAYDALKAVRPDIRVIAGGISSEANDRTSTSPVRFLKALGDAYRSSGRSTPIMDALSFHVYPRRNTDPPSRRVVWPNVGPSDLARLKQAVWDAFAGTGQPTFPEGPVNRDAGGLRLFVGEFGWQVGIVPALAGRHTGRETVPTVSEDDQARFYAETIGILSCDPAVKDALVLHLVDEVDLGRFQSGIMRIDFSERPSYGAVRTAIAAAGGCKTPVSWTHTTGVVGAKAIFDKRDYHAKISVFGFSATAAEEANAKAGIFRVSGPDSPPSSDEVARSLTQAKGPLRPVATVSKLVKAGYTPRLEFRGRLQPGYYVFGIRLTAAMNPRRSQTFVSSVFTVRAVP
jgi:hypothetical protein